MSLFRRVIRPSSTAEVVRECEKLISKKKKSEGDPGKVLAEISAVVMLQMKADQFNHREIIKVLESHVELRVRSSGFIHWITNPLQDPQTCSKLRVHETTRVLQIFNLLEIQSFDIQKAMLNQIDGLLTTNKFNAHDAALSIVTLFRALHLNSKDDLMVRLVTWLSKSALNSLSSTPDIALSLLQVMWSGVFDPENKIPNGRKSRIEISILKTCERSLDSFDLFRRFRLMELVTNKQLLPPVAPRKLLKRSILGIAGDIAEQLSLSEISKTIAVVERDQIHSRVIHTGSQPYTELGLERYYAMRHSIPQSLRRSLRQISITRLTTSPNWNRKGGPVELNTVLPMLHLLKNMPIAWIELARIIIHEAYRIRGIEGGMYIIDSGELFCGVARYSQADPTFGIRLKQLSPEMCFNCGNGDYTLKSMIAILRAASRSMFLISTLTTALLTSINKSSTSDVFSLPLAFQRSVITSYAAISVSVKTLFNENVAWDPSVQFRLKTHSDALNSDSLDDCIIESEKQSVFNYSELKLLSRTDILSYVNDIVNVSGANTIPLEVVKHIEMNIGDGRNLSFKEITNLFNTADMNGCILFKKFIKKPTLLSPSDIPRFLDVTMRGWGSLEDPEIVIYEILDCLFMSSFSDSISLQTAIQGLLQLFKLPSINFHYSWAQRYFSIIEKELFESQVCLATEILKCCVAAQKSGIISEGVILVVNEHCVKYLSHLSMSDVELWCRKVFGSSVSYSSSNSISQSYLLLSLSNQLSERDRQSLSEILLSDSSAISMVSPEFSGSSVAVYLPDSLPGLEDSDCVQWTSTVDEILEIARELPI